MILKRAYTQHMQRDIWKKYLQKRDHLAIDRFARN